METATLKIADLLEQSIGLTVNSIGASTFKRALNNRKKLLGIEDDEAYLDKLTVSFMELRRLVEEVVVPETWFFRDQEPFSYLMKYVYDSPKDMSVDIFRLLSLPCSTGEEPYSIAMTMLQGGLKPTSFYIDAVDVSNRSLTIAKNGVYTKNSFRTKDVEFRDNFFHKTDAGYSLNSMVREKVRFLQGNILQPGFLDSLGRYDVVFCRNLLIYFNKDAQEQAIKGLYNLLVPGGLLFTGHSEASLFMGTRFRPVAHSRAFAFHKQPEVQEPPVITPVHEIQDVEAQEEPAGLTKTSLFRRPRPSAGKTSLRPKENVQDDFVHAQELADEGHLEEAAIFCEKNLRKNGPSAKWFYLLGIIWDSLGKTDEAIRYFRKAVYLDPGHVESLTQLALIAERSGDMKTAENFKRRARKVSERK